VWIACSRTFLLITVASFAAVGCSESKFESRVSGTVKLDGQPIGPGVVTFAPHGATTNPALGAIQPDGSYELKTSRDLGLHAGKYSVSLQIVELPTDLAPGQRDMRPTKSRIPEKFTSNDSSGLEFEVAPGRNTIDIEMMSNK
jgi:hypothetical protein